MTPEHPPDRTPEGEPFRWQAPFGPEAVASVDRSLAALRDPDDALRILAHITEHGAAFAAYLLIPDTNLTSPDIGDTFTDSYVAPWHHFHEFRTDALEGLGWLDAVNDVIKTHGIPEDHLTWNTAAIDKQLLDTYDAIHLDGWWHIFHK